MTAEFSTLEKWSGRVGNFLIGSLAVTIQITVWEENWFLLFITLITLVLFIATKWISKRLYYELPITFQVAILLFIFLTLYVGDGLYIYWRYGWYDVVAHALAGAALGFTGFLMLYMAMLRHKVLLPAFYAGLFAFSFSVMLGVAWEFFEYFMDTFAGTQMIKGSGYDDIMWDLIGDTLGALLASIVGYFYIQGKQIYIFSATMDYFVSINEKKLKQKTK